MPPAPNLLLTLVVIVSLALSIVVMCFGAVWSRLRQIARPLADTARLVDDLAQRQRTMESLLARLDATGPSAKGRPAASSRRGDRAAPSALSGPTLIAVPNLAATPAEVTAAASAAAELARRFGAIWAMSEMGAAPEAIAHETGQPIGQIELILGLRRQLATAAAGPAGNRP